MNLTKVARRPPRVGESDSRIRGQLCRRRTTSQCPRAARTDECEDAPRRLSRISSTRQIFDKFLGNLPGERALARAGSVLRQHGARAFTPRVRRRCHPLHLLRAGASGACAPPRRRRASQALPGSPSYLRVLWKTSLRVDAFGVVALCVRRCVRNFLTVQQILTQKFRALRASANFDKIFARSVR